MSCPYRILLDKNVFLSLISLDTLSGWNPFPFVTFAVISISGSISSLMLPETAGKVIQEQIIVTDYGSTRECISIISSAEDECRADLCEKNGP